MEKNIKSTQRSLKDVEKLLKLDPTNTELLAQKQKILQEEIGQTEEKLKALREADKQAKKQLDAGDLGRDKYDALQREIAETENNLKSLKREAGSGSATLAQISSATGKFGNTMKSAGQALVPVTGALTAAGAASVSMANDFEDAMSQAAGALNIPLDQIGELRELAIQVGQDTIFSATEAGNAITELAKGGLTEADIKAGALQTTMDLAASSSMDLGAAANTVVQAMGAFGLSADQSAEAANALAGAAAASSTDVEPLTQGLAQCSAQANNAGWSIQETTAVLGRFADAGITGSDAGTSLKTMLQRLAAPTDTAATKIEKLGINTRDSSGNLLGAADMAEELQNKLGGLSAAERDAALQTIFGSDATRAATVMMNSGEEGLQKYIAATNDQESAQRLANSQMSDTSRAIEEMKGSLETAAITIGNALAPAVEKVAEFISNLADKFSSLPSGVQTAIVVIAGIVAALGPLLIIIGQVSIGISSLTAAFSALSIPILPVIGIIAGVVAAIAAVIAIVKNWGTIVEWFRGVWNTVWTNVQNLWNTVWTAISQNQIVQAIVTTVQNLFNGLVNTLSSIWNTIQTVASNAWELIKNVILGPVLLLIDLVTGDFEMLESDAKNIWNNIKTAATNIWNSIKDTVSNIASNLKDSAVKAFKNMISGIKSALSGLGDIVKNRFQSAIDFITSLPGKAVEWGRDFIDGMKDGIMSGIDGIVSAVKGVGDKIRSFLHFSRPDEGPLRDYETWMPDMMKGLANGIYENLPVLDKAVSAAARSINYEIMKDTPAQTIDYNRMYSAVRAGAENSNTVLYIGGRQFKRVLKGMGVAFEG